MNSCEHVATALDFLELADSVFAERNPLLRSELLWCAAAHAVKAVAKRRGWRNESHDDLFQVVRLLARSHRNSDLRDSFRIANLLHRNMYEGYLDDRVIARYHRQVRQLVHWLAELVE